MILQSKSREKHEGSLGVNATYAPYPEACKLKVCFLSALRAEGKCF